MKKKCIIIGIIVFVIIISFLLCFRLKNNKDKFYLSNKYYNNGSFITETSVEVQKLVNNKESFLLFTYNNYCTLPIPCEDIFKEFSKNNNIDVVSIPFSDFKNTSLYKTVKYAPSIIVVKEGKIVSYLDAERDDDLNKYQDVNEYREWLNNYIYFSK